MPELPEVELVAKSLDRLVAGRRISGAELLRERLAPDCPPCNFARQLTDARINRVYRRGKHILFDLANDRTLLAHLRMTGRFLLLAADRENPKHTHAVFYFEDRARLAFQDQRHFGLMKIVETGRLAEAPEIKKLAPEPFSDAFSLKYFRSVLGASKKSLKELLLDQTKVCGLGNIYASEAMFLARVNPQTTAAGVSARKARNLFEKIREVLREAVEHGSTLDVDPENIDGSYFGGGFENRWRVYDRERERCINCGTPIARIVQAGRSTYFCRRCQR